MCGSEEIGLTWSRAQAALKVLWEDGRDSRPMREACVQRPPLHLEPKGFLGGFFGLGIGIPNFSTTLR